MSRLPRRSALLVPIVLASGLALTACGNDGVAIQSREHSTNRGVDAQLGNVLIRNAEITLGGGGTGLLAVALFNDGTGADSLVSVSSPQASSIELPRGATAFAGAYAGATPSDTRTVAVPPSSSRPASSRPASSRPVGVTTSPTTRSSPSTSTSRSTVPSAQPADQGASSISLPGQTGVFLNTGLTQLTVRGLPADAVVGVSIPVTFSFAGAGNISVQVPVSGAPTAGSTASPLPTVSDADNQDGPPSSAPPSRFAPQEPVPPTLEPPPTTEGSPPA